MFPGKYMNFILLNPKQIFLICYFEQGQTIKWQYYTNLLDKLNKKISEKGLGLAKNKVIFHKDNTWPHASISAMVLYARFSFIWLSSVLQMQKIPWWKKILVEWWDKKRQWIIKLRIKALKYPRTKCVKVIFSFNY